TCWDINGLGDGGTERIDAGINYAAGVIEMSIPGVPGRASGLPMCAGILRLEHFAMGRIPHALAFTMAGGDQCSPWVSPGTRVVRPDAYASTGDPRHPRGCRDGYVATGMIFAIPPGPLPTDLQPATRIILRALQDFGTICVDRGGESSLLIDGSQPMAEW